MYSIAQFVITDENLNQFRRLVKKPEDCVINALEILAILPGTCADIARILVGDYGVSIDKITAIFKYMTDLQGMRLQWRFTRYTNFDTLVSFCKGPMQRGCVIFVGIETNVSKHVLLIGKDTSGKIIYIDPQIDTYCDLSVGECFTLLSQSTRYYFILQTTATENQMQYIQHLI